MNAAVRHLPVVAFLASYACAFCAYAAPLHLFVSPNGNDTWSGTRAGKRLLSKTDGPFRTLERARDAIRELKATGAFPSDGVVVELTPGVHRRTNVFELMAEDSGTDAPIIYRAQRRGTATISGGETITTWQSVSDPTIVDRLDSKAGANVVCAEIPGTLLEEIPGFANGGCGYRGKREFPLALFQEERRLPVARWPNNTYTNMGECLGNSWERGHVGVCYSDGIFRFEDERLKRWVDEPDLWFDGLWFHAWADQKMRLKAIDLQEKTISLLDPKSHHFGYKHGRPFYAFNAISEIDRPGEWVVDRTTRRLYLWPQAKPETAPVTLASCDGLVIGTGISSIRFEGLVFEACRERALVFKNTTGVTVSGCTLRHLGSTAIEFDGGTDGTVFGCDFHDLGEGGVIARGGVYESLTPGNHVIENNHIHHFGLIVNTYRPAAAIYGVGNTIRHNLVYQAQHQALFFKGNDHLLEYNIVHDVCLNTNDAGAIYACHYDWSQRGTILRYNLIHTTGEPLPGHSATKGIYMDDQTTGTTIHGNIVSSCKGPGIVVSNRDHTVTNNLAINCNTGLMLSTRGINSFCAPNVKKARDSIQFTKLFKKLDLFKSDLWRERYPRLLAPMDEDPILAHCSHGNVFRNNASAGSGTLKVSDKANIKDTCTIENNVDLEAGPGFVERQRLDLRLRPDAPVFSAVPGFEPIPFETFGLYDDPRRASPAVKFGPNVSPMPRIVAPSARAQGRLPIPVTVPTVRTPTVIDGDLAPGEWGERTEATGVVRWGRDEREAPFTSHVWMNADAANLYVAIHSTIDPKRKATRGHRWGRDDGVEIALAPARTADLPARMTPVVLRGYADGSFESVTDSGLAEDSAALAGAGVVYAAARLGRGAWSAEWQIPLAGLGVDFSETNWPILAHITVRTPTGDHWVGWRKRVVTDTWNVDGAYALCLEAFGSVPFIPVFPTSAIRVDVQGERGAENLSMEPGTGATAPSWARKWNRLVAAFGAARADQWQECQFEFMPKADATVRLEVMGTQSLGATPLVWTYYDDFRVQGAELVNGDFETIGDGGKIPGWNCVLDERFETVGPGEAGVVRKPELAASGECMARTSHDHRVTQGIKIIKGRKVTVNFKARGVLPK
ncbi:MAG: hypothetical protein HN742_40980 [Lentisphaerae bacterium]|jgi:parallel beta-helix repeat protein|nr:hypothetical protein [Lentisphaerota bacterium]MBT4820447.1 hypothetical protein [Lentisphaerota bacterium]MBT5609830.1 hypothetical protein [Lentisphaerota bacterium]MBT7059868.1 hypothetical protein [Lentisphaerota bacterium]MBT7848311.1 hypothetical protein [Lentisphaerota bacterium]